MGLRLIHSGFIAAATLLFLGFALWNFSPSMHAPGTGSVALGILSAFLGLGSMGYGGHFLRHSADLT